MEMSERLYCFLQFICIVSVWDAFENLSTEYFAVASIVIIQLVQFDSANLLLMAKDRDLFSIRNHVRTINFQLM